MLQHNATHSNTSKHPPLGLTVRTECDKLPHSECLAQRKCPINEARVSDIQG